MFANNPNRGNLPTVTHTFAIKIIGFALLAQALFANISTADDLYKRESQGGHHCVCPYKARAMEAYDAGRQPARYYRIEDSDYVLVVPFELSQTQSWHHSAQDVDRPQFHQQPAQSTTSNHVDRSKTRLQQIDQWLAAVNNKIKTQVRPVDF